MSDQKRTKLVAREMMRMVDEINRRLDSLPGRASPGLQVTCNTCHRGTSRPVPLSVLITDAATAAAAEAAFREAVRRDTTNVEAKGRLRAIGKQP